MFEAIALVNVIRDVQAALSPGIPIVGMVQSHALSGGSLILQACAVRYATPTSILMVHGISQRMLGLDETNAKRNLSLLQQLRGTFVDLYSARSPKSRSYWDKLMKTDTRTYFTAQEALEVGLLDEIR